MKTTILSIAKKIIDGILAGMLISLGGIVFIACASSGLEYGKYIGAVFFSLALLCICMRGYALYTGKIGLVPEKHTKEDISLLLLCLLGNAIGTIAFGYLTRFIFPNFGEYALEMCTGKLAQGYGFGLLRGVFCGLLVYLAVDIWRNNKSTVGILMCIPAFILSGFEHSIADIFYFAASGMVSGEAFLYLIMIIIGNSIGGLIIPLLQMVKPAPPQE
ncbi:MAG: formate/nitrite transporter family protein [Clostridia bacterium]|nr:formate/nitrite transporter family protein [Clostridia bacterium]